MPLYAFELRDPKTGEMVRYFDVPLPVNMRDSLTRKQAEEHVGEIANDRTLELVRQTVPQRIGLAGITAHPGNNESLRCLYRAEQRMGSSTEFHQKIGFSPETYKNAWKNHRVNDNAE